jgi:hypothetical protein
MSGFARRTHVKALLASLLVAALPVQAGGVFKCSENGKTVYTDVPCVQESAQQGAARPRSSAATSVDVAKPHPQVPSHANASAQEEHGVARGAIGIGMTAEKVLKSWGLPMKVTRIVKAGHVQEHWLYGDGRHVNVDDGRVSAVQQSRDL